MVEPTTETCCQVGSGVPDTDKEARSINSKNIRTL